MNVQTIKQKIMPLLRQYNVRKAGLFGSVVRGEHRSDSDVDILVEMPKTSGLFDFLALQSDLEEALSCPVDLVEYDAVRMRLKPYILGEQQSILSTQ